MKFAVAGLAALGIALSGCATIVNGTTQSVSVTSTPDGAKCELKNSEGTWYVTSPGSAVVHKTKNDLTVTCTKDGYQQAQVIVPAKFGAATAGNVIAGGIIGVGIDAASGANYTYPATTAVTLVAASAPAMQAEEEMAAGAMDDEPVPASGSAAPGM